MTMLSQAHRGLAYGDGHMSGPGLKGQLVKIAGSDLFAVNAGEGALSTPSFGILLKDYADGQMPGILCDGGVAETDVFVGDPQPGDGLYCGPTGKLTVGYDDATQAVKASLSTGTLGTDKINWLAQTGGTGGNNISVTLVESGAETPLSVAVAGSDITVNLETDDQSDAISTVAEVLAAVADSSPASALVRATSADTGVVAAAAKASLANGANAALRIGRVISVVNGLMKFKLDI